MELLNATKMQAGYTMGMRPDGRESIVVVVKGTYTIPENGEEPVLAEEQVPLVEADVFTGEPGYSAVLYESDYAPVKHKCDVLFNGSAYAPGGRPTTSTEVSLQVGSMYKSFRVVGDRVWGESVFGIKASDPVPFTRMPFSYDNAFGGFDSSHDDPKKHRAYSDNPVGVGFHSNMDKAQVIGKPLPNTEELDNPVTSLSGKYKPMALGPIGRHFEERVAYAGTYDDDWLNNTFPFLPIDFGDKYYQASPNNQQISYLKGGEVVSLLNLSLEGRLSFKIPHTILPVMFFKRDFEEVEMEAVADTLYFEPDERRFSITWRASIELSKNIFEVVQCVVGLMPKGWYRARILGKEYYPSLGVYIEEKFD